ncbi:hypothetical protein ES703_119991 [subsurface metagenome]
MNTTKRHKTSIPQGDVLKKSVQSKTWRKTFRRLLDKMPENIRRWNAALLAMQLGYGGMKIAGEISGLSQPTLHKARQELENSQVDWDCPRQRRSGGGRKRIEQTCPDILNDLKKLVEDETAGNPSSDDCWVNRTSRKLATAMGKFGHDISHVTVIRLLKKLD